MKKKKDESEAATTGQWFLYPTHASVGYKIARFTEKYKSFFGKKFAFLTQNRNFGTTHKFGGIVLDKVMKQALHRLFRKQANLFTRKGLCAIIKISVTKCPSVPSGWRKG